MLDGIIPYYEYPHREWPALLARHSLNESQTIFIPWGFHERERGVVDFSRSSRHCIERLLEEMGELRRPVNIRFGFYGPQSIPDWLQASERRAILPSRGILETGGKFNVLSFPHFDQPVFIEAFNNFVFEASEILNLYREPDGPVVSVGFDPGFFRNDLSLPVIPDLQAHLTEHYLNEKQFNAVFGTNFSSLNAENYLKRLPLLLEKRCWVTCSDLRTIQRKRLSLWMGRIPINGPKEAETSRLKGVWFFNDSLLIFGREIFPYLPGGIPNHSLLGSYRKAAEVFRGDLFAGKGEDFAIVYSDKWIGQEEYDRFFGLAHGGRDVLFLTGIPVYNRRMAVLSEGHLSRVESVSFGTSVFGRRKIGTGNFYYPMTVPSNWDVFCSDFQRLIQRKQNG